MELVYKKLYDKYTALKINKLSELEQRKEEQEDKFLTYLAAAEELIDHLRSENDKLNGQIDDLTNELASVRNSKDNQIANFQRLLMEERIKRHQMDKFLVKRPRSSVDECGSSSQQQREPRVEVNLDELPSDPGLRRKIATYHPNDQDKIRRAYLQKGPCQPKNHNFPQRRIGGSKRRFLSAWFTEFGNWIEYNIEKDAANCLYCYLFRPVYGKQGAGDTFVTVGFNSWNKKDKISSHVGGPNSAHNIAFSLVTYIESDVFNKIDSELIIQRFQNMKSRRGQL